MQQSASPPLETPSQWQEAWKSGRPEVLSHYAAGPWETPTGALEARRPLTGEAVGQWRELLRPHAGEADLSGLDVLCQEDALVVVTGQQAGAALGPLYTLYKAFAARHWAREISRKTGRPCLPIFWIASDDHDLAEVRDIAWLDAEGNRHARPIAPPDRPNRRSVFREPIDPDLVETFLTEFADSTRETEFRPAVLAALRDAAAAGDFEGQFLSLFCRFMLPLGVYPIVPRLPFLRKGAAGIFRREIEAPGTGSRLVMEAGASIEALGQPAPLHRKGNEVNFFLDVDGIRARVVEEEGVFLVMEPGTGRELARHSSSELAGLLDAAPARFSPNALLRPLVQDAVLPTAAYIAGPTEMVYHGQVGCLYKHFNVPRPAVYPRPNVFLLETKHTRAISRLGADAGALLREGSPAQAKAILEELLASDGDGKILEDHLEKVKAELEAAGRHIASLGRDAAVEKALGKLTQSMDTGAEKLRDRVRAHLANRDANLAAAREKLLDGLFPGGTPQERSIGFLAPLLVQYGPGILPRIADALDYEAKGFQAPALTDLTG